MVFANLIFLFLFLPLHLVFYLVSTNRTYRNYVLILFSLAFYAWGEPVWVTLLIFSASIDYIHGQVIERYFGRWPAKLALISSLVLNLGLLAAFKYSGFLMQNINALTGLGLPVPSFALPIGISFYTFQTISYTIDVYRGEVQAQRSFSKFLMYVSMFPQLVAGPIVRYSTVAREIEERTVTVADLTAGFNCLCAGLAKKVLVANSAGVFVAQYLDGDLTTLSAAQAWFGVIMFSVQLYFDFSGYSDMAIGMARMLGFHFEKNFNYPYISKSITDFWRRWHISLGSFFRDYVYIPLGGNRRHQYRNILIVWFLTGLWHGASWNFVFWGLYYGFFLLLEKKFYLKFLQRHALVGHLYRSFIVTVGWALFYFTDMNRLGLCLKAMFGMSVNPSSNLQLSVTLANNAFWLLLIVLFCCPVTVWVNSWLNKKASARVSLACRTAQLGLNVLVIFLCTCSLVGQSYNPFLYFKF